MLKSVELKTQNASLTDGDTLVLINKTIKELDEEYETYKKAGREEQASVIAYQKGLLEKYLPKLMSEEEIESEITKLDDKSLKNVMIHFKTNFQGKCDMKLVSQVAKKFN